MYYTIEGLCPIDHMDIGRHAFGIHLHPQWRDLVARSSLTQEKINGMLLKLGRFWLDACGFDRHTMPEMSGLDDIFTDKTKLRPKYSFLPLRDLSVKWGEWGVEHITVPGNACGLDITDGIPAPRYGRYLSPHNIDGWNQKYLLLLAFTHIASAVVTLSKKDQTAV